MAKSVIILGGGVAGLASAVFLSKKGLKISIYESSPKWGGRTYSYFDSEKNIYLDNGQHILAGWYENTFEYLKIIGTYNKLKIRENLNLVFYDKEKKRYELNCSNLPGVYSLLSGILKFKGFNVNDKKKFFKIKSLLNQKKFSDNYLKKVNVAELLYKLQQTNNLKKYFWHPLIFAAFNTIPENVSADLFVKLIKKGTEFKKNMSIILSNCSLNDLFIDSAIDYLEKNSVLLKKSTGVKKINIIDNKIQNVEIISGEKVSADYYFSAIPYYLYENIVEKKDYSKYFYSIDKLKSSTIISVHLFFEKELELNADDEMIGLVDTVVQWVFVKSKRHLCLVISGADFIENNLTDKSNEEIFKICINDLKSCLDGFNEKNIIDYKVIKERRATFIPDVGSENFRIEQKSDINNLFIAGDWTNTGYPATIESAIKSAKICTDLINNNFN
jgi:hydroxysqualene dehydroxylase